MVDSALKLFINAIHKVYGDEWIVHEQYDVNDINGSHILFFATKDNEFAVFKGRFQFKSVKIERIFHHAALV